MFEPTNAVQYTFVDGSFMRFDLSADGANATYLSFTLHALPSKEWEIGGDPGGDLPAGRDIAWRPGFVVGFHHMIALLDPFLLGEWTLADNRRELDRFTAEDWDDADLVLLQVYRDHIREHCPPA